MEENFTLLLIDDQKSNLITLETLIIENFDIDINIIKAYNGEEGLKEITRNDVNLILSDVQMPVMDGFEFARILKQNKKYSSIPFIFVTAMHISDDFVKEGLELGAVDYIRKPINSSIFIAKLKVFIKLYEAKANLRKVNEQLTEQIMKSQVQETQMIQQARLAQMGEMISMIAHQWRQPLASISAITNTLLVDAELGTLETGFLKDRLASISELSEHLSQTVNDFRDFFKPDKQKQPFLIETAVKETLNVLAPFLMDTTVNITVNDKEEIVSYKNEVMQVLLNILSNAIDAMGQNISRKGVLDISITKEKEGYSSISITDNGGGVAENIIEKIFDPYFSTKSKNGTGLGLYMSKTIIEEHCGGRLSLYNTDTGSCFKIELPVTFSQEEVGTRL